jgi:hypothetical protein
VRSTCWLTHAPESCTAFAQAAAVQGMPSNTTCRATAHIATRGHTCVARSNDGMTLAMKFSRSASCSGRARLDASERSIIAAS